LRNSEYKINNTNVLFAIENQAKRNSKSVIALFAIHKILIYLYREIIFSNCKALY